MEFIPLVLIALLFWFLVIQPQRRRTRRQAAVWDALEAGQEVMTAGGLYGRVRRVDESDVQLEIAENTVVRVAKQAIQGRVAGAAGEPDPR